VVTSLTDSTRGSVRGERISGAPVDRRVRSRRVGRPRGTGFDRSPGVSIASRYAKNPDTDDSRRWIVRGDSPVEPSSATTLRSTPRCERMNAMTSDGRTRHGSFATKSKKIRRSNAAARTVFGRHRPDTNAR
jgi:hypothetical protein